MLDRLRSLSSLWIHQQKEWLEIISGFEKRNKYEIWDDCNNRLFQVSASWDSRFRGPFKTVIRSDENTIVLRLTREFRWYYHCTEVHEGADGQFIGRIQRQIRFPGNLYTVHSADDTELFRVTRTHPWAWTFRIIKGRAEVGRISKEIHDVLKEVISDANDFRIVFPPGITAYDKALLLGALFLIDEMHFDR